MSAADFILDVLLELSQQSVDVLLASKADHDFELLNLDVGRVIILAEEDAHFIRQNVGAFLQKEIDVTESYPLNFWSR